MINKFSLIYQENVVDGILEYLQGVTKEITLETPYPGLTLRSDTCVNY